MKKIDLQRGAFALTELMACVMIAACGGGTERDTGTEQVDATDARAEALRYRIRGDKVAPSLSITAPTGGTATKLSSVLVYGNVADNVQISRVAWRNDRGGSGSAVLGTGNSSGTWGVQSVALQPAANKITITAFDAAGNSTEASVTVMQSAAAPAPAPAPPAPPPLAVNAGGVRSEDSDTCEDNEKVDEDKEEDDDDEYADVKEDEDEEGGDTDIAGGGGVGVNAAGLWYWGKSCVISCSRSLGA